ncbi:MAG: alpha/beta fold hydrolase [Planctomycetota bacterium]
MRIVAFLLLLTPFARAERVTFQTSDDVQIVGTWQSGGKDAPTVICLPMYRSVRQTYKPLAGPLLLKGMNLLALDLRGHGESTPGLAPGVQKRDPALFQAMHLDVRAAIDWCVRVKKCDPTRIALIGASVGCSVAVDAARRYPGDVRAVVLLTPGANYLGVNTLEHLKEWRGTRSLTFVSTEEKATSQPVMDALDRFDGANYMVVPGKRIHGTRMLGKVNQIEELIANFLESSLAKPVDLRVHDKTTLHRKGDGVEAWVTAGPKACTVRVPEGFRGSATITLDKAKHRLKFDGKTAEASWAWAWKPGQACVVEVRSSKGRKLRFPARDRYALQPVLDE